MRLLLDMNLSPRWCEVLGAADFQCSHWSEVGLASATDAEVMRYADEHGCVVVTHDLDFGAILAATGGRKPSVVQIRSDDLTPETGAERLAEVLRACSDDLAAGALLTVDLRRARVTLLPLRT